jgi:DNA adenine methylase
MVIPHPIPYQGSKRSLAPAIIGYFPDDTARFIEPFAGSAAVTLAAAYHRKGLQFVLNDINAPLMTLWQSIVCEPERLADEYEVLWCAQLGHERAFYDRVRADFNQTYRPDYFLYLLARCVKASVRYNSNGEFNQSPDNRRKGRRPEAMRQDILAASRLLNGKSRFMSGNYLDALYDASPADLVYLDPPYQGVSSNRDPRYLQGLSASDFIQSLHDLNQRGVSYIVSYDGRTGLKTFGAALPDSLGLTRIELDAGRSSQATLLGRAERTYESLYLSPALIERLKLSPAISLPQSKQLMLFGDMV